MIQSSKPNSQSPDASGMTLKQPPLTLDMDPTIIASSKIKSKQSLLTSLQRCLIKIQQMIQTTKQNERLEKYFVKAGTNSAEILIVFSKLLQDLVIIKGKLGEKDTNLIVIGGILVFMDQILYKNDLQAMKNIQKAIWIVEFQSKVICSMQFVMTSLSVPYDITSVDKKLFQHVWDRIKFQRLGDEKKVKNGLDFTKKVLVITTSACLEEEKRDFALTKLMSFGLSYPQYFISDKEGQLRSMTFYRKPTIQMARKIWNLPENGMTRQLSKIGMKSIESNFKIYIPVDESKEPKDLTVDDGASIQVRVLHNDKIYLRNRKPPRFSFCSASDVEVDKNIQTIILHMHGGGFVALSSRSMQVYTRRWARDLKIPVFSVDYRMPPEHRFPTAPMDCLKVYKFLINKIHLYYNIRPKKIIIAGDSAGGNLAFSLTGLILKQSLPAPHGVFAAYPACDLRKEFSPSKLFAFTDPLLNPSMLILCLNEYLNGKLEDSVNPLASPVFLTEEFVGGEVGDKSFPKKWPKTIIQVGAQDPLYDDSIKMMERMVSSKIDCECQVYENLSHGFLNLEFLISECQKAVHDSTKHIAKLLK